MKESGYEIMNDYVINYDNITVEDCDENMRYKHRTVELNDGHVLRIVGEDKAHAGVNWENYIR